MMMGHFTFDWFFGIIESVEKVIKIATLNAITLLRKKGKGNQRKSFVAYLSRCKSPNFHF